MNEKEQLLYNRVKMIVSTTACEHNLTYADIENALVRVYEEEHSEYEEMLKVKPKEAVIHIGKEESEVEKARARARAYYHKHKAKILEQRKENRDSGNGRKRTRTKFTSEMKSLMSENQNLMPIEMAKKIKQITGVDVTPSAISNWRYNHNKPKKVEPKVEEKEEEVEKKSVQDFFQQ